MEEKKLSELQREYRRFFIEKMKKYGVDSPAQLSKEDKSKFFLEIKKDWAEYKTQKNKPKIQEVTISGRQYDELPIRPVQTYEIGVKLAEETRQGGIRRPITKNKGKSDQNDNRGKETDRQIQIIKSEPNVEQTDDLKIGFIPNDFFKQDVAYTYPVVKMPAKGSYLKLPRNGRSNQKGYKEDDFYYEIKNRIKGIEVSNNLHMVIPHHNKPYEPDIVLLDKNLNLYIDVEIDEPYDGYFRYPTHCLDSEEQTKKDDIRDLFFTESGWVVIRFTEKQVHCQPIECIELLINVINSVRNLPFSKEINCIAEPQWDYNQCIQWQKIYYREKYLNIDRFQKQFSQVELQIDTDEVDCIEKNIQRTKKFAARNQWSSSIAFDEETHVYLKPQDETGNAEYISVTTLIERFFPFDLNRYIERRAQEENRTEEDVLDEYFSMRDEAAYKGTELHNQIECFFKQLAYDPYSKEFSLFEQFFNKEVKPRGLLFFDAEMMICSDRYNVAGTIDCLLKKENKDEFVMLDWKRSKKLIIDGRPRVFGHGYALSELSHLDNSSYYRYCLQQNIYRHIVQSEYDMIISSMKLVVLHENYSNYYVVDVPIMENEVGIILNSLKVKI